MRVRDNRAGIAARQLQQGAKPINRTTLVQTGADRAAHRSSWDVASRVLFFAVSLLAFALGFSLWVGASDTATFFAWKIPSPTAASALGGFYVAIGLYALMAALTSHWEERRSVFPPAIAGPALLLIPTALHSSLFDFGHTVTTSLGYSTTTTRSGQVLAWAWLILYATFPPVLLVLYAGGAMRFRGLSSEANMPTWQRLVLVVPAVALSVIGLVFLLEPGTLVSHWAWPLTPLLAQVYACWMVAGGIWLAALAWERRWQNMRVGVRAILAAALCLALGPFLHPGQLRVVGALFAWLAILAAVGVVAGGLLWVNKR